jgi:peptide/nickel transport system permease protein
MRLFQQAFFIIVLLLFLSVIPSIIEVNPTNNSVEWNVERIPSIYSQFIKEIAHGSLGTYTTGLNERQISDDIVNNFTNSLLILIVGVHLAIFLSIIFGLFIQRFRFTRVFTMIFNLFSMIPDFILVIFSMILAVQIYKVTGIRLISLRPDAGMLNIWFPMILVAIAPTLYLFKLITVKYFQISGEDYIRTAVAKGMPIHYINLHHIYKNIEPFLLAELTKTISLAVGNMFIIEYLLNVPGITVFIFTSFEFQPITIGLFSILLIAFVVYVLVRLTLFIFKRGMIHE